ncbi:MAG: glycosyltransferase family 87 protein [Chitinophagales bacterium]
MHEKRQNTAFLIVAFILLLAYFIRAGVINGWEMHSDFPNYYVSARALLEGKDITKIYDNAWFQQQIDSYGIHQTGKFLPFPPPTAFVMLPLAPFDPLIAKRIWLVINLLLLIPLIRVISRTTGISLFQSALLLLVTGVALTNNFYLGQVYVPLLLSMFYGYDLARRNKSFVAGMIWGIAASIKYITVILLIPYLIKRDKKILPGFITGFLLLHVIAFPLMGVEVYRQYISIFYAHLNGKIEGQTPFAYQFQSWDALLRRLFIVDPANNPSPLIQSDFLFQFIRASIELVVILIAGKMVYDLRKHPHFIELSFAVIGISCFEILPESSSYTFLLLSFPFIFFYLNTEKALPQLASQTILWLFITIGCLPILLQEIVQPDSWFIFYRLLLMTLFYGLSILWLSKIINRHAPERL